MKKLFALVAVLGLALAVPFSAANAGCKIKSNTSDGNITCNSTRNFTRTINISQSANITSNSTNVVNTGNNYITSGDDVKNSSITTGKAELGVESSVTVNSVVIDLEPAPQSEADSVIKDNTAEDGNITTNVTDNVTDKVNYDSSTTVKETETNRINTGGSGISADDDVEGSSVSSGNSFLAVFKTRFYNIFRIK